MLKICKSCGIEKDISLFKKDKSIKSGYKNTCSACGAKTAKDWYLKNPDQAKQSRKKWSSENAKRKSEIGKEWYANNSDKVKERSAAHRINNADKVSEYQRKYRSENKEKIRELKLVWASNNKEKLKEYANANYAKNPKKCNQRAKEWRDKNPELTKMYCQNYRALKLSEGGKLSKGLEEKLFKLQKGKCACGCAQPLGDNYHMDHRMPLALGGSNTDDNMQILTQKCNNQKHAKDPIDFMQSRGFLL